MSQTSIAGLLLSCVIWVDAKNFGHRRNPDGPYEFIASPRPHEDPKVVGNLPKTWDWRNVGGKDFSARIQNQHQPGPNYCGACWAFATITHLAARFNVARGSRWPEAQPNVQVLLACGPNLNNGCDGSNPDAALKFIHEYGLPHESCHTFQGVSLECTPYNICQDCMHGYEPKECWTRERFPMYHIKEYGYIKPHGSVSDPNLEKRKAIIDDMVVRMKAEIWKRGPIVCQIVCPDPKAGTATSPFLQSGQKFEFGQVQGYMSDYTPYYNIAGENFPPFILNNTDYECPNGDWDTCVDHDITVVGWGEEKGAPYWIIQNSWGDWWGEGGFFRIVMGVNNLGIESMCFFGVPDVSGVQIDSTGYAHFPMGTAALFAERFKESAEMEYRTDPEPIVVYS